MQDKHDVFIERMVIRKPSLRSRLIQLIPWLAVPILVFVALYFLLDLSIALMVLLGGSFGAWQIFIRQYVEFEYILTNGELDVDRIAARRTRRRLLTVDSRHMEILAPCIPAYNREMNGTNIEKRVDASSSPQSDNRYFAIFRGKDSKRTILFFEPDQKMLNAFRAFVPSGNFKKDRPW